MDDELVQIIDAQRVADELWENVPDEVLEPVDLITGPDGSQREVYFDGSYVTYPPGAKRFTSI